MLSILVSFSSLSIANPTGVFCRETMTSWERYKYWRWWLDLPYFYSPRISLRSWLQERNGRMKWGCTEGSWCSVPGAEQLWVDSPAHICMLTVLPRQKLGTFGSGSMNFQNRTGNTQLWVWPLLLFVKLSIQVSFLVSAPVPWNVLPLQMVVSKHKLKNYERALIQGLQWI